MSGETEKKEASNKELFCYHCGTKKNALLYCELWMVTACKDCMQINHKSHHKTCKREIPKNATAEPPRRAMFRVTLTRFDGQKIGLLMRLGDSLEMEEHWAGTYIFAPQTLLLVMEDIPTINKTILAGLRGLKVAGSRR